MIDRLTYSRVFFGSLLGVAPIFAGIGCERSGAPVGAATTESKNTLAMAGKVAPTVELQSVDGKEMKLSDLKGKVVILDFWATWCGPCAKSLPHLDAMASNPMLKEKGLVVWAINLRETPEEVKAFLAAKKLTLPVLMDATGMVAEAYMVDPIPATVVIGRDGVVSKAFVGLKPQTGQEIEDAVNLALSQK